jgi:hypothetical protein
MKSSSKLSLVIATVGGMLMSKAGWYDRMETMDKMGYQPKPKRGGKNKLRIKKAKTHGKNKKNKRRK